MRILIDECIDRKLRGYLPGHECETAGYAGFGGLKNGGLLTAAQKAEFDVLVTVDRGNEYQQNLSLRKIAVIILCANSIRLQDLVPLMGACLECMKSIRPGQIIRIAE